MKLILVLSSIIACFSQEELGGVAFPSAIHLRAAVFHNPPLAVVETTSNGTTAFSGFQIDLCSRLVELAALDGFNLSFTFAIAPPTYGGAFDLVSNDCTEKNPNSGELCNSTDIIIGDYYPSADRVLRARLSPSWSSAAIATVKSLNNTVQPDITTMKEAASTGAPVCLKEGTFFSGFVRMGYPDVNFLSCGSVDHCLELLKQGDCALNADSELTLRFRAAFDVSLGVTRETLLLNTLVWPISFGMSRGTSILLAGWMYTTAAEGTTKRLFSQYFQKAICPVGTAGEQCELPCHPVHGEANEVGECICVSTKWTGSDCSVEVPEDFNYIPQTVLTIAYVLLGTIWAVVIFCAGWLFAKRATPQVRVSQPFFLACVLVGCVISSSTILALAQEDTDGKTPVCMAIPWLYSVGFSITFGTLFAKIRRAYIVFKNAVQCRRHSVSAQETAMVIGIVLMIDVVILVAWTLIDPLEWQREVVSTDKFGNPLESQGFCSSEHWGIFAGLTATFHLCLLLVASYLCFISRLVPSTVSRRSSSSLGCESVTATFRF